MLITTHFALEEFIYSDTAVAQGIDNTPGPDALCQLGVMASMLEEIRTILGYPILITSGYRCASLNAAIGGVSDSAHLYGRAVDIMIEGMTPLEICKELENYMAGLGIDQLIHESGWVHIGRAAPDCEPRCQALTINEHGTYNGFVA